jgi:hypothetical protein
MLWLALWTERIEWMRWLIHVTPWEKVSTWRRLLGAFGRVATLIALLTVLLTLFGPPVAIFTTARLEAKKIPGVKVTPQPLTDYSVSDAPGTVLSSFGYSFEVPWSGSFNTKGTKKEFVQSGMMLFKFETGQQLLLIAPSNQNGFLSEMIQDKQLQMANLQPVLGDLTNLSAYDQYSALLNTAPSTIRAFGPRADAVRGETLLTIKAIALPAGLETGAFSFEFPDKRGFQIGDPRKSKSVQLEVFDVSGHNVEVICETHKDSVRLTQAELNRILKTLHTIPLDSFSVQATRADAPPN